MLKVPNRVSKMFVKLAINLGCFVKQDRVCPWHVRSVSLLVIMLVYLSLCLCQRMLRILSDYISVLNKKFLPGSIHIHAHTHNINTGGRLYKPDM